MKGENTVSLVLCKKCGKHIYDSETICPYCGVSLIESAEERSDEKDIVESTYEMKDCILSVAIATIIVLLVKTVMQTASMLLIGTVSEEMLMAYAAAKSAGSFAYLFSFIALVASTISFFYLSKKRLNRQGNLALDIYQ